MVKVAIIPASYMHIDPVASNARQSDIDEFFALSLSTPREVLTTALRVSPKAWCGLINGEPAAVFGVSPRGLLSNTGVPWLVGTDLLEKHQKVFLRRCRGVVDEMTEGYKRLENYVDARNITAINWLKWLGFTVEPATPYGFLQKPFHHFYLNKDRANV